MITHTGSFQLKRDAGSEAERIFAGIERIEHHFFNGTQIQRNYCSLFFGRRGDWDVVERAYKAGLIDEIQAYAR